MSNGQINKTIMAVSFTGVLKVVVVEATDLRPPDLANTKSLDAYCIVSIDDATLARTTHKPRTFNPRWSEVKKRGWVCVWMWI